MKFISICSGIEAASVAFAPIGWGAIAFSEIEPFPCAVLAHRHPTVPNLGDMTKFRDWPDKVFAEADAIVGGPPCQAFSVAGLRNSLDDNRGNLTLMYSEIINHADEVRLEHGKPPVIVLYENVPGILKTHDNAFGCFLAGLAGESVPLTAPGGKWPNAGAVVGPQRNLAWRVLDAQYFGLAQRRKRVFVVASARDGFDPARVIFESEGVRRDSPPSRDEGQGVAGTVGARTGRSIGAQDAACGHLLTAAFKGGQGAAAGSIGYAEELSPTLSSADSGSNRVPVCLTTAFKWNAQAAQLPSEGRDCSINDGLTCSQQGAVAYALQANTIGRQPHNGGNGLGFAPELAPTLTKTDRHGVATGVDPSLMATLCALDDAKWGSNQWVKEGKAILQQSQVRRLTSVECERLQGFPDNYTLIPWRGKQASDCPHGPRYKALGNSWAVPVVRWIGWRIWAELNT